MALVGATGCRQLLGLDDLPSRDAVVNPDVSLVDAYVPDAGACQTLGPQCAGPTLRTCTVLGELPVDTPCAWGCSETNGAHCNKLQPAGGAVIATDLDPTPGLIDTNLPSGTVIDSTDGTISSGIRTSGIGIKNGIDFEIRNGVGIFRFNSLATSGIGFVSAKGDKPMALVAAGSITLSVELRAQADCEGGIGGPGGGRGSIGDAIGDGGGGGGTCLTNCSGGSGAGHGAVGGDGGMANGPPTPVGGVAFGDTTITTLQGGGGGGGGGGQSAGIGGGGGGGLQLASNGLIRITTGINAGGCGGGGANLDAGGGGGAGGTILVEAPHVTLVGGIAVNGGGGGGGRNGTRGEDGSISTAPAAGGTASEGQGGKGGASGASAENGGQNNKHGGGGGGAVGRIRVNTFTGAIELDVGAFLSPSLAEPNTTTTQGVAIVQ
jgi:hypothetical protein